MNPALLGTAAALSWGTLDFVSRYPTRAIGHLNTVFATTVTGFVLLSLLVWLGDYPVVLHWHAAWLVALSGATLALATLWLFAALVIGPISIVSPVVASYPVLSVAWAFLMGSRPTAMEWAAMAAVVLGVVMVSAVVSPLERAARIDASHLARVLPLAFLANLAFAVSLTSGQAAAPALGEVQVAWLARPFGAALLLALYMRPAARFEMPPHLWPVLLAMGAFDAAGIGLVLAASAMPKAEIAQVTASCFGVVTVVLAWVLLREPIPPARWIGMVMIFAGIAVLSS
jgi:drug/metabolite transporter (DMT)-like permease